MRLRTKSLLVLAILPVLAVTGCTNSDPTLTGNNALTITVELLNPGTRFDNVAQLDISQINVRPNDEAADAALGASPIGLLTSAEQILNVNLNEGIEFVPTSLTLSSGSWRISEMRINNVFLVASDTTPSTTCDGYFFYVSPPGEIKYTAADLAGEANFVVSATGEDRLAIQIDAAAFVQAFTGTWDCVSDPPIPVTFREDDFVALAPTYYELVE